MRFIIMALPAFLIGCGVSEDQFEDEYLQATCDKLFECTDSADIEAAGDFWFFGADSAECYDILTSGDTVADTGSSEEEAECSYDKSAASECLADYEALSCDDYAAASFPESCNNVYTCE